MAKHLIQFTQINFDAKMRKCKTAKNIQICENVEEFALFEMRRVQKGLTTIAFSNR